MAYRRAAAEEQQDAAVGEGVGGAGTTLSKQAAPLLKHAPPPRSFDESEGSEVCRAVPSRADPAPDVTYEDD